MKEKNARGDGLSLKLLEILIYILTVYLSYRVTLSLDMFMGYDERNYQAFNSTLPFIMIFSVILLMSIGLLNSVNKSKSENIVIAFLSTSFIMIAYMAIAFYNRDFAMPRSVILFSYAIQTVTFIIIKLSFRWFIRYRKGTKEILVIGQLDDKERLISKIFSSDIHKERLKYFVDPSIVKNFKMYIDKTDKVYVSDTTHSEIKDSIITHCISTNKSLYIVPKTFEIAIFNSKLVQVSDIPMFKIDSLHLSREKLLIKRFFDLIISIPLFVLLLPLLIVIALALVITEGRPVIFKQERVTIHNRVFNLYKFRSMHKDAEKESGAIWAVENDPRVTKLGRFLRRFWLDELPQLINVIKGDMSLVGPRPERPIFINEFTKKIPDFHYRVTVKAGVTGLAQVLGKYATTPELKIKFDILYIKNCSIFFDLKIIFETLKKIILGTLKRGEKNDLPYKVVLERHNLKEKFGKGSIKYI